MKPMTIIAASLAILVSGACLAATVAAITGPAKSSAGATHSTVRVAAMNESAITHKKIGSTPHAYTTPDTSGAYGNPGGSSWDFRGGDLDKSLRGGH